VGDVVGDAAEQEAAGAGHALVADHDQVGLGLLGDVEDRLSGVGLYRVGLNLDPLFLGRGCGGVEDQVDVLARADLVLDVRRGAGLLAGDALIWDGGVGADNAECRAGKLGEVDGLAHGLGGGL